VNILSLAYASEIKIKDLVLEDRVEYKELSYLEPPLGCALPAPISLKKLIEAANEADVVYFHLTHPPSEVVLIPLRLGTETTLIGGFRSFLQETISMHKMYKPFFKKITGAFDVLHVLNRSMKEMLNNWGYMNVFLIPNGVDTRAFTLREAEQEEFVVLFSGYLADYKGVHELRKIIRKVYSERNLKNIRFVITGEGPEKSIVQSLVKDYENVQFMGYVHPTSMPQIYRKASLFLHLSFTEGMPSTVLEARSCGLPSVCFNVPGVEDILTGSNGARVVNKGNIGASVEAIGFYYQLWHDSPSEYYELSQRVRRDIINRFDLDDINRKFESMLLVASKGKK